MPNNVRRKFRLAVKQHGGIAKAAELIGCSRPHIYNLMDTEVMPAVDLAHRIQTFLHIPMEWWDSSERTDETTNAAKGCQEIK